MRLQGAYAYGVEPELRNRRTFEAAAELVARRDLGRLVSASYPLDRFKDAIDHAAHAGSRGATKIVFAPQEVSPRKRETLMPRPGFVLEVDRSTPPTLFWHGEGYRLEKLPDR